MKNSKYRLLGFLVGFMLPPIDNYFGVSHSFYMAAFILSPLIYFIFGVIIQEIFVAGFTNGKFLDKSTDVKVENKAGKIGSYWFFFILGLLAFWTILNLGIFPGFLFSPHP